MGGMELEWTAIIVAVLALLGTIYAGRQSRIAGERATNLERHKIDAEAYARAQRITALAIDELEQRVNRLRDDLNRTSNDLNRTRVELDRTRDALETTRQQLERVTTERDTERELNRVYRARVRRLEAALRDSGLPIPTETDE